MEKGIIIISENLPSGLQANICAILGMALGKNHPHIVGHNVLTQDRQEIAGITKIPLPILQSSQQRLSEIFEGYRNEDVFMVIFDDCALTTKNYADFQEKMSSTPAPHIQIHGLLAYGPRRSINKIGADLPLLR